MNLVRNGDLYFCDVGCVAACAGDKQVGQWIYNGASGHPVPTNVSALSPVPGSIRRITGWIDTTPGGVTLAVHTGRPGAANRSSAANGPSTARNSGRTANGSTPAKLDTMDKCLLNWWPISRPCSMKTPIWRLHRSGHIDLSQILEIGEFSSKEWLHPVHWVTEWRSCLQFHSLTSRSRITVRQTHQQVKPTHSRLARRATAPKWKSRRWK